MKQNRCKRVMAEGGIPLGHMLMEFNPPGIGQMLATAGLDFVLIDLEHSRFTLESVAAMVAAVNGAGIAPFVRVPGVVPHYISRVLDCGALGVMVPNVKTAEQAESVVRAAKYAPLGDRGVILGNVQTDYRSADPATFFVEANQNTTVICQIESVEGLENLEAIASVSGVDILWVGHGDLSQSMGIAGQFDHPDFLAALDRIAAVARDHGLGAGAQPRSVAQAEAWIARGYTVISYGSDHGVYVSSLGQAVAAVRAITAG